MPNYKIMFSNIGYAKGINGYLHQHIVNANRYFYCSPAVQQKVLHQLKMLIKKEAPDICCLVEIDQGSVHSGYHNQLETLFDNQYPFHNIASKYGEKGLLRKMPLHKGKCNAFLAKQDFPFERLYFSRGGKRLVYHLTLPDEVHLFFAHFSLREKMRAQQFKELSRLVAAVSGEVIILGDFNILKGLEELAPLMQHRPLVLLNREEEHTFTFHRSRLLLDLCLCSPSLVKNASLRVIEQPFSDHAALMLELQL